MAMGRVQEAPLALGWAGPSTQSAPPPQPLPRAAASAALRLSAWWRAGGSPSRQGPLRKAWGPPAPTESKHA